MEEKMTVVRATDNLEQNIYPKLGVQDDLLILHSIRFLNLYKKSALVRTFILAIQFLIASALLISLVSIFYWKPSPIFMKLEYLPYLGLCSVGLLSNMFVIVAQKELLQIAHSAKEHAWCYKSGGSETYARILESCKYTKILHIFLSSIWIVSIISICPLREDDKAWQAPLFFLDVYSGYWKPFFLIPYYFFMLVSVFSCIINLDMCNYTMCQITFQYHLLNHFVIRLGKFSEENIDEEGYQEEIYKRITILIRMHTQIKKFSSLILVMADSGTILLSLSALNLFLCVATFIIFDVQPESNIRFCLISIPVLLSSLIFPSYAQRAVDESERVYYNALNCEWFNWNTKNRRAYLTFLTNNIKPMSFTTSGISDVDLRLLMNVSKIGYTLLTLFLNLKKEAKHK